MKHLIIFENHKSPTFIKIDDLLLVNIQANFWLDTTNSTYIKTRKSIFNTWSKSTLITGISRLLGTKYENNEKFREIEMPDEILQVNDQTKKAIIRQFLTEFDYDNNRMISRQTLNYLYYPNHRFYWMMKESKNIGEVIDKMKEFKKLFIKNENLFYKPWKLEKEADKYNL